MKKHNVLVTMNGVSKSRAQWAQELGVTKGAISHRESKGESASSAISGISGTLHTRKILEHYAHAKAKHPHFCDLVLWDDEPSLTAGSLRVARMRLKVAIKSNSVSAINDLLDCELREFSDALANGDKAQAVEELYDCIAVCLRTIDVLKGWQKLGKPDLSS